MIFFKWTNKRKSLRVIYNYKVFIDYANENINYAS